jgi:hypothetical protein
MDTYLAAVASDPRLVHELPLPPQLEQIVQLKETLIKGGKKRHRRSPSPSSSDSSDSDDSSDDCKGKDAPHKRDTSPDTSSSDPDASSDTKKKAHKRHSGKSGKHILKYGLPPMAMFDGSLKPGEVDDKIPCLHHWFKELESRAKRLEMPIIELLTIQTIAAAKRWAINEQKKEVHTKLYKPKRRKASDKDIKKEFYNINLRHLKFKKIRDMGKLLKGSIKQLPNEQVSQYVLRFRTQLGEADCGGYAQDSRLNSMLCFYFREGLLPHLRKYAHSDDKAQPFVDLDSLINHIYGKEDEVTDMQSTVDTTGRLAAYNDSRYNRSRLQVPPPQQRERGKGRGRGGYSGGYDRGYGGSGGYPSHGGGRGMNNPPPHYMTRGPPSAYTAPPPRGAQPQGGHGGRRPPPPDLKAGRREGGLRAAAIAAMRDIYPRRQPEYDWDDDTLANYYNKFNKARMCPVCQVNTHIAKDCPEVTHGSHGGGFPRGHDSYDAEMNALYGTAEQWEAAGVRERAREREEHRNETGMYPEDDPDHPDYERPSDES